MRTRPSKLCLALIVACVLVAFTGCEDGNQVFEFPGDENNAGNNGSNNPPPGGGADIDVTQATPASGDTNISGSGVTVQTSADTLDGGATPATRVQLDATSDGNQRRVLVYFETATGTPRATSYLWGAADVNENVVYCPAAGCSGVSVNMATKEIFFSNTALDDNNPFGPATKFATLSLGAIQYP